MKNPRKIDEKIVAGRTKHGIIKILRRGRAEEFCGAHFRKKSPRRKNHAEKSTHEV
ncbi:MAG: hypothetical protein ACLTBS_06190 [Eisenbergiella sp.]